MLKSSIEKLIRRENLNAKICQDVLSEILHEDGNELQISVFLALLRSKGETLEELTGLITGLKQNRISLQSTHKTLDIVGTGGDGANTINISTASAILAASCGIKIVKNGNRSVSSMTGSADVLEAMGVNINMSPEKIIRCIDEVGFAFCYSPLFHPTMLKLRELRKKLALPTSFNLLGPLLNPANPEHVILGVFDESLMPLMAETLQKMGTKRSLVVHGLGLDEISCAGPLKIFDVHRGEIKKSQIDALEYGFSRCDISALKGGDAKTNAEIFLDLFSGRALQKNKALAETLILNAAIALYIYGQNTSIEAAIPVARENLQSGKTLSLLKKLVEFSHDE